MGDLGVSASPSWAGSAAKLEPYTGPPRNVGWIDAIQFDESLAPPKYEIFGTDPKSKILITDVNILDSTGREPFKGDVLIEGMPLLEQMHLHIVVAKIWPVTRSTLHCCWSC